MQQEHTDRANCSGLPGAGCLTPAHSFAASLVGKRCGRNGSGPLDVIYLYNTLNCF